MKLNLFNENEFDKFILKNFNLENNNQKINFFLKNFFKEPKNFIKVFFGINKLRMMNSFKVSSGILGLMIALSNKSYNPPYYVVGIGFDKSGYSYSTKSINDRKNHILADLNFLKSIKTNKTLSDKICFTNKNANNLFLKI